MLRQFRDRFVSAAQGADSWIAAEAAKRAAGNRSAGIANQRQYLETTPAETAASRVASQFGRDESWRRGLIQKMSDPGKRAAIAESYAPQMNRGPMQLTQRGVMEAINQGIAENALVRRGALPLAIGAGGVGAGVAVTTAAQNLLALIDFMSGGRRQQQQIAQSPLIEQSPLA
jgi:hypothetical protein